MEGVDYSFTRPDVFCLAAQGVRFAVRYFGAGTADKRASPAECAGIAAAGMSVVAVCEQWEDSALGGAGLGIQHAQLAAAEVAAAGAPGDAPIYFAVDFDASPNQLNQVSYYFNGIHQVIGWERTGIYGGFRTVEYAAAVGLSKWYWQTYAWSYGQWSQHNHMEQYSNGHHMCGGTVDLTRSVKKQFGQWRPGEGMVAGDDGGPHPSLTSAGWDLSSNFGNASAGCQYLRDLHNGAARTVEGMA